MTLALEYAFDSRPNPIRASPQDGPPNTITLTVGISNPGASLSIDGISIEFGGPNPSGWLTNQQFPTPSQPEGQNWSCHWSGRTLELEPNGAIEAPVAFVIEDIVVSAAQGPGPVTVPLTITEDNGQPDGTSYSLVKQPSDCIVTDFWADPASIDTLKQTVTLHWTVTDAGQTLDYQLEAGSWMPCQCLEDGNCYQYTDGSRGVPSDGLSDTTVFELDVIGTHDGTRELIPPPFYLRVRWSGPWISKHSFSEVRGTVALLHWSAANATSCQVQLNGKLYDDDAPLDTPPLGYPVLIGTDGQENTFWVDAVKEGSTPAQRQLESQSTGTPMRLQGVPPATGGAVPSADGRSAYLATAHGVAVVDLATHTVTATLTPFGTGACSAVALVPGSGQLAVASADSPGLVVGPANEPLPSTWDTSYGLVLLAHPVAAIASGGTTFVALASDVTGFFGSLPRFDGLADDQGIATAPNLASVAITFDGNTAMTPGPAGFNPRVHFYPTGGDGPSEFALMDEQPTCVAISPDAQLALAGMGDQIFVADPAAARARPA